MAKLDIKKQNTFAWNLAAANNIAEFGSKKAGSPEYSIDPDDIQSRTQYASGLDSSWSQNASPYFQDFNALFFLITRQLEYLQQTGIPEWITTNTYQIGSLVSDGTCNIFMSVTDENTGNALTTAANWMPYRTSAKAIISAFSTDYVVNNSEKSIHIHVFPNLSNRVCSVRLPTPTALNIGREIIVQYTSTPTPDWYHYVYAADGSTIDGAANSYIATPYQSKIYVSNGTNWSVI